MPLALAPLSSMPVPLWEGLSIWSVVMHEDKNAKSVCVCVSLSHVAFCLFLPTNSLHAFLKFWYYPFCIHSYGMHAGWWERCAVFPTFCPRTISVPIPFRALWHSLTTGGEPTRGLPLLPRGKFCSGNPHYQGEGEAGLSNTDDSKWHSMPVLLSRYILYSTETHAWCPVLLSCFWWVVVVRSFLYTL